MLKVEVKAERTEEENIEFELLLTIHLAETTWKIKEYVV